jgi:hypothetical protein
MTGPGRFDPAELGTDRADELEDALAAASWLETTLDVPQVTPSGSFGDGVMAALAGEPTPSAVGFMAPVRRRGYVAGFAASVREAWASVGGGGRPFFARASALAYVLAVVIAGTSLVGVATIGIVGALGIVGPTSTQSAAPPSPAPSSKPDSSLPSAESAPPPTPAETDEPSESPDASDDHGGVGADPSDDHGETSTPRSSGDDGEDSGSESSDSGSGTPHPSTTPRPSRTPNPSETPESSETPN